MNLIDTQAALAAYLSADIPAFLWGAPGLGKSDIVRQTAKAADLPMIDLRAVLLDPVDLRGLPIVADGKSTWCSPAFLPDAARDGESGILFLDELNAAAPSVQAACFQLVLDRRCGEYVLPDGWRIVAAGNRQTDRAAAQRMPTALANRFAHIDVQPDVESWAQWASAAMLSPVVIAFVRWRPALLHAMDKSDGRAFPTPRSWAQVAKIIDSGISDALRFQLVTGLIGDGAAAELEGFCRCYASLPRIADILAAPDAASVPDDISAQYAIAAALARNANPGNLQQIVRYLERMPAEYAALCMTDAVSRDKSLSQAPGFTQWASRNAIGVRS